MQLTSFISFIVIEFMTITGVKVRFDINIKKIRCPNTCQKGNISILLKGTKGFHLKNSEKSGNGIKMINNVKFGEFINIFPENNIS